MFLYFNIVLMFLYLFHNFFAETWGFPSLS